jgi:GNAT superfamily N-acetyltransferase
MIIRDLRTEDKARWLPLWQGYLDFYETALDPKITDITWARLLDPNEPMFALVAEDQAALVGLAHCVTHRGTWTIENHCYLEDLFVAQSTRGKGVGRALIEAVYKRADDLHCSRAYWLTHETNLAAQALYDKIGVKSGFIQYRRP